MKVRCKGVTKNLNYYRNTKLNKLTSKKSPAAIVKEELVQRSLGLVSGKDTDFVWCSGLTLLTNWWIHGYTLCILVLEHLKIKMKTMVKNINIL